MDQFLNTLQIPALKSQPLKLFFPSPGARINNLSSVYLEPIIALIRLYYDLSIGIVPLTSFCIEL